MKEIEIEKLRQLVSRTDMRGNQKVDWLVNFITEREQALRIHDVVWRSELLPKRLSNTAYRNAQSMTYAEFVGWWDEQV